MPNDTAKKLTERKISLGTFSIDGLNTLPGILFFNDAWIENVSYAIDEDLDRDKVVEIDPGEEEIEVCMHDFTEYIRAKASCIAEGFDSYICSKCKTELSYVKLDKLPHDFAEEKVAPTYEAQGYTLCTCKVCGHTEKKDYVEKLEPTPTPVPVPDVKANVINGISVGEDFFVGNTITFTASGANMDITPTDHARRYVPASWSVNPSGTWDSAPYIASFTIEKPGTYTLKVTFKEQEYLMKMEN